MANPLPWMPFYGHDFYAAIEVRVMDEVQQYGYFRLLWLQWCEGYIPDNIGALTQILHWDAAAMSRNWPRIGPCFKPGPVRGTLINGRLALERENAQARKPRGAAGGRAKWGSDPERDAATASAKQLRRDRMEKARMIATHTPEEWQRLVALSGGICLRCGGLGPLVKDHIVPIYQGGSDGIENLQPLCKKCNASKGPERIDFRGLGTAKGSASPLQGSTHPQSHPQPPSPPGGGDGARSAPQTRARARAAGAASSSPDRHPVEQGKPPTGAEQRAMTKRLLDLAAEFKRVAFDAVAEGPERQRLISVGMQLREWAINPAGRPPVSVLIEQLPAEARNLGLIVSTAERNGRGAIPPGGTQ